MPTAGTSPRHSDLGSDHRSFTDSPAGLQVVLSPLALVRLGLGRALEGEHLCIVVAQMITRGIRVDRRPFNYVRSVWLTAREPLTDDERKVARPLSMRHDRYAEALFPGLTLDSVQSGTG